MFSLVFDILEPSAVICTDFSHLEHTGDVCNLLMFLRVFGVCFSLRLFIFPWFFSRNGTQPYMSTSGL